MNRFSTAAKVGVFAVVTTLAGIFIYQFVSKNDEETLRILKDVIILAAHANPDGMELVSDWYMRNPNEKQRANFGLPATEWKDGVCNSPHGASMDKNGDLIVSEWSQFGHLHKFLRAR